MLLLLRLKLLHRCKACACSTIVRLEVAGIRARDSKLLLVLLLLELGFVNDVRLDCVLLLLLAESFRGRMMCLVSVAGLVM